MQYPLTELGYFSERECEFIREIMDGRTSKCIKVKYSNHAGNCTLIIETDYDGTETEIKNMFFHAVLTRLVIERETTNFVLNRR